MKDQLLELIQKAMDDARYLVYYFNPDGTHRTEFMPKEYVENLLKHCTLVAPHESYPDVIRLSSDIGLGLQGFVENIVYETPDTDGYLEHVSKYNKYYKVFIRIDRKNKTIEFKIGDRYKKLELVEHTKYVSKPFRQKYMHCLNVDDLEKHIADEFLNPRMVNIGRQVLKLDLPRLIPFEQQVTT